MANEDEVDPVDAADGSEIPDAELDDIEDAENNTDDSPTDDNGEANQ